MNEAFEQARKEGLLALRSQYLEKAMLHGFFIYHYSGVFL